MFEIIPFLAFSLPQYPPAEDIHRFPGRKVVWSTMEFGDSRKRYLESDALMFAHHARRNWDMIREVNVGLNSWDLLDGCWETYEVLQWQMTEEDKQAEIECLRLRLKSLKEAIGVDAYERGIMPAIIPYRQFRMVNKP